MQCLRAYLQCLQSLFESVYRDNNNVYVDAQNLLHKSANNQDCSTTLKTILLVLCESGDEEFDGPTMFKVLHIRFKFLKPFNHMFFTIFLCVNDGSFVD
jgi:hypothetical protein